MHPLKNTLKVGERDYSNIVLPQAFSYDIHEINTYGFLQSNRPNLQGNS